MREVYWTRRRIVAIVGLFLITLLLYISGILSYIFYPVSYLLRPVQRGLFQASQGINRTYNQIIKSREVLQQNTYLTEQLAAFAYNTSRLNTLEEENQRLQDLLTYTDRSEYNIGLAYIVGKTIDGNANTLLIDQGSADGIKVGDSAIFGDGVLVGKVVNVSAHQSTILLLTSPESILPARIQNTDSTLGLAAGEHEISIVMDLIPLNTPLEIGEIVVTSSLAKETPAGLVIGTITKINEVNGDLFKQAIIKPLIDYKSLRTIGIIKN
jgi:rod shape-determining protein MreC